MTTIPIPIAHTPSASAGTHVRTTPQELQRIQITVGIASVLLFVIAYLAVSQVRSAIQTVGNDSAPSIIAAQHIHAKLADMDSNAANALLGKPGSNEPAEKAYEADRTEVADNLVAAAKNITFGDKEQKPIETLVENFPAYQGFVSEARTLHERGELGARVAYRNASDLMHNTLLPAADAVDKVNNDYLTSAYDGQKSISVVMRGLLIVVGIVLLIPLILGQRFLSRRFRRTLNLPMLGATALALLFVLYTFVQLGAARENLKVAKEDAFDSVRALWLTRAAAYDANGEESRWLLDKPQADKYQAAFFAKTKQLASLPPGQTYDSLAATLQNSPAPGDFTGHLADELKNITFPGEKEAALATLRAFGVYMSIDTRIRALENTGNHTEAIALCIGNNPGESDWAYDQFDQALGKTLDINQVEFNNNIDAGRQHLRGYDLLAPVVALGIVGLTLLGLRPRLQEYAL